MKILEAIGYLIELAMIISVPATIFLIIWAMGAVKGVW